jgi:phosphomethylpyrimidine synthase
MTRIEYAKKGIVTDEMKAVAKAEGICPEKLAEDIANGLSLISRNINHKIEPLGIGRGMRTKINANIGTSKDKISFEQEFQKLEVCVKFGCDAVMDLSTGGAIRNLRQQLIAKSPLSVGTVPLYDALVRTVEKHKTIAKLTVDDFFQVIEDHAEDGVDFITVHCGVTLSAIERMKNDPRMMNVVSRGGSFTLEWMVFNEKENPLYEHYDRLVELAKKYDIALSLGDGFRPGCIADATDRSQIEELITLGELRDRALEAGVQAMIEGPGHVPINQVEMNIKLQKEICKGAPFYVLGPLVTDLGMGYDHITAAIGGAIAGAAGADFLCYVTPAEHIRLPNIDDVRDGIIASKIAAHAADIAKGVPGAIEKDRKMAERRKNYDWEGQAALSFNPELVMKWRAELPPQVDEVCSMCGEFCAMKAVDRALEKVQEKREKACK